MDKDVITVRVYDSGPEIGRDRYSVFSLDDHVECLSLSADADSPQGTSQWCEADEEDFDKRILLEDLPASAYRALEKRMRSAYYGSTAIADDPVGQPQATVEPILSPLGPRSRPSAMAERADMPILETATMSL